MNSTPYIVIVGQIPPPWHGQAVATKMLFDYEWPGCEVTKVRMAFSGVMDEVGRLRFGKLVHLFQLAGEIREAAHGKKDAILLYPPASPAWIPVLRDLVLLCAVRRHFKHLIFIQHAGGLGEWAEKSKFRRLLSRFIYRDADLFMEVAKEPDPPHQVFGSRSWAWIPYGVEVPDPPQPAPREPGVCRVMFLGSLQEGKGVLEVLKTAAALAAAGHGERFKFVMVGPWFSDAFKNETLATVSELGVEAMVEFAGQLVGDAKWEAFQNSDIFFFPTHYSSEAFPLVLIEALGNGLPVVTTQWRGIPDMLEGCAAARLCPIKCPTEYRDALLELADAINHGHSFAEISRSFYRERYLPKHFLEQVCSLVKCVGGADFPALSQGPRSFIPIGADYRAEVGASEEARTVELAPASRKPPQKGSLNLSVYLADQNPGHDRSMGISRMSDVVLRMMATRNDINLHVVSSRSSQQGPESGAALHVLPWSTRSKFARIATDHLHPLLPWKNNHPDIWYYPKGFLPRFSISDTPAVVTVHDTIIQYYWDHYPGWRKPSEYAYWAQMLKSSLVMADGIFTVSENAKRQILRFMERHQIPKKPILVTYEPCIYERYPQPQGMTKENFVLHLASREPHKRSEYLIRWWISECEKNQDLPALHLVGHVQNEVKHLVETHPRIVKHPFLPDDALRDIIARAKALILPSEIEGFGLPAIEAYYLGTPVCFTLGTSVEEILEGSTSTGGFQLDAPETIRPALEQVLAMPPAEIRRIGLELRERYAARKVVDRMLQGFREVIAEKLNPRSRESTQK